jgi:hypothetical protein
MMKILDCNYIIIVVVDFFVVNFVLFCQLALVGIFSFLKHHVIFNFYNLIIIK